MKSIREITNEESKEERVLLEAPPLPPLERPPCWPPPDRLPRYPEPRLESPPGRGRCGRQNYVIFLKTGYTLGAHCNFEKDSTSKRTQLRTTQLRTTELRKGPNTECNSTSNFELRTSKNVKAHIYINIIF